MTTTEQLDLHVEAHERQRCQLCRCIMDNAVEKINRLGYRVKIRYGQGTAVLNTGRLWFEIDQQRYDLGAVDPRNPGAAPGAITAPS